jgi:eukaryotic-like serine/threonine-protein kinase
LEARPIQYTEEAIRARAEGMMSVRCVVTVAGRLEQCRVVRSVPLMERAVLDALASRRYRPAMYRGQPIPVEKSFDIWLVVPRQ